MTNRKYSTSNGHKTAQTAIKYGATLAAILALLGSCIWLYPQLSQEHKNAVAQSVIDGGKDIVSSASKATSKKVEKLIDGVGNG